MPLSNPHTKEIISKVDTLPFHNVTASNEYVTFYVYTYVHLRTFDHLSSLFDTFTAMLQLVDKCLSRDNK